jgi:hypothetical protein
MKHKIFIFPSSARKSPKLVLLFVHGFERGEGVHHA